MASKRSKRIHTPPLNLFDSDHTPSSDDSDYSVDNESILLNLATTKRKMLLRKSAKRDWSIEHQYRAHFMGNGEAAAVWRVEMEPSGPTCYPNMRLVATVGGNAACFVDSNTCKPVIKYQEKDEELWCAAWTTIPFPTSVCNILAVGGHFVHLLSPKHKICFHHMNPHPEYKVVTLDWHPIYSTVLVTGSADKTITMHDIGAPRGINFKVEPIELTVIKVKESVNFLQLSPSGKLLGACCGTTHIGGLSLWKLDLEYMQESIDNHRAMNQPPCAALIIKDIDLTACEGFTFISAKEMVLNVSGRFILCKLQVGRSNKRFNITISTMADLTGPVDLDWCFPTYHYESRRYTVAEKNGGIWIFQLPEGYLVAGDEIEPTWFLRSGIEGINEVIHISEDKIIAACDNNLVCQWILT